MNELTVAEGDADVRRAWAHGLEEDEIARLHLVTVNWPSYLELRLDLAGELLSVLGKHVADEPAAVETRGIGPSVPVWDATEGERGCDEQRGASG